MGSKTVVVLKQNLKAIMKLFLIFGELRNFFQKKKLMSFKASA
jgi:hypothetical protein